MVDEQTHFIWTIQIAKWRYARDLNIPLTDITVKSGICEFSPERQDLYAYRRGEMSMMEYARRYHQKVINDLNIKIHSWDRFLNQKNVALACYCPAGNFCHRYLFANLLVTFLQQNGRSVEYKGELIPHSDNNNLY